MQILRQSTASQAIKLGPFVDSTDGVTAETGLTIANTDIQVSKAGGAFGNKNSGGGTHDTDGWYTATLDATDTATVGILDIQVTVTGALPVMARFQVVETAIYDGFYADGATALPTDVVSISGDATSAVNLAGSTLGVVSTTVTGTPTTTTFNLTAGSTVDDTYNGRIVVVTSGTNAGSAFEITDYTGSTKLVTFATQAFTLSASDKIVIV